MTPSLFSKAWLKKPLNSMISFLTYFEICCISCMNILLTEAKRQHFKIQDENHRQVSFCPKANLNGICSHFCQSICYTRIKSCAIKQILLKKV